jgi:phage-related holin
MTAQQVNEAGGEKWAATLIVVRDAYERMGLTAAQAEGDVAKLFDTRNPDQAREAMARINGVVSDYRAILAGVNEQMGDLLTQADALGIRLPQALLDSLNAAVQLGDMTEENARLIASLTQASEVDWQKFEEAAKRYGIAVDALGQQFQQHQISKTAQQMVDDMDLLLRGGATMGTILFGMKEEISTVVQNAMRFGTELPENMRPWIEELQRAGLLVDAQGQALTDITNLRFGESMQTTFQRVADSIQELVDLLKGPLTNALDTVGAKVVKPRVEIDVEGGDGSIWDGTRNGYAHGGVVYAAGGWVPRGTDTVPAMLTPGEGVLSRRGMAMLGALNNGTAGGGGVTVNVNLAGATLFEDSTRTAQRITDVVSRELVRQVSRERKFAAVMQ